MLDPLTAISLAGTIVQFLDFSSKVISKTRQLTKSASGTTEEVLNVEHVTRDLLNLSQNLRDGNPSESNHHDDQKLKALCNGCIAFSERLLAKFAKLKVEPGSGTIILLQQAVRVVWSRRELDELADQLGQYRSQLELHIFVAFKRTWTSSRPSPRLCGGEYKCPTLTSFRKKYDLDVLSQKSSLDVTSKRLISALRDNQDVFEAAFLDQNQMFASLHQDMTDLTLEEHQITRDIILDAITEGRQEPRAGLESLSIVEKTRRKNEAKMRHAEAKFLRSLKFPSISERYTRVAEAHAKTFDWIFNNPKSEDRPWSSFSRWLQSGQGIYWINGKAGSGKSTLMKYLYNHERTRELLAIWAGSVQLDTAQFFFWNSGNALQKSQVGLLRSLLHGIISKHKDLVWEVFPDEWKQDDQQPSEWRVLEWNLANIGKALDLIRARQDLRICLFIDGLDEYESDSESSLTDMITVLIKLSSCPNIKICSSSRPWLIFEDVFHLFPSLRLQDLTRSDITRYVVDKVNHHKRLKQLHNSSPEETDTLIRDLVEKASGVFLWVVLVVRSLLEGLTNRDRIPDLQKRLALLPADLENLYEHMLLKHIDPLYRDQASRIFQMACAAEGVERLSILSLDFACEDDPDLPLTSAIHPMSIEDLKFRSSEMTDILKSRCGGLLEVSEDEDTLDDGSAYTVHRNETGKSIIHVGARCAPTGSYPMNEQIKHSSYEPTETPEKPGNVYSHYAFYPSVQYLHRTVRDFLQLPETRSLIIAWTRTSFNPCESLARGYVLHLKKGIVPTYDISVPHRLAGSVVKFAARYANPTGTSNHKILDELDKVVMHHWMGVRREILCDPSQATIDLRESGLHWASHWFDRYGPGSDQEHNFISLAVSLRLIDYVQWKLEQNASLVREKRGRPLLLYVSSQSEPIWLKLRLISLLVKYGADPNACFADEWSIWRAAVTCCWDVPSSDSDVVVQMCENCGGSKCVQTKRR
ncbi:hypothetical protein LSUE1_G006018 [Lachnellula suecica]|uniref:NACHT domain-containing protein n=1 Tax=Lachnellula suecica TaxID=602035 RepID=A0A8T9C560_9HELO|nr:hypothetical protein LSUE1_G006018 [Lachnellula suecica]